MRRTAFCLVAVTCVAAFLVAPAPAQSTTAVSIEAGALSAFEESLIQIGIRGAPTRGGFATVDVSFATLPDALFHGVLIALMDLDGTYGVPLDSTTAAFFPRVGVSMITGGRVTGDGGGGAAVGYNIGAGIAFRASEHLGVRVDFTYRRFRGLDVPFSSITAGLILR